MECDITPSSIPVSNHTKESPKRHVFKDLKQVDDIISNATHQISQTDGATVFVQKVGKGGKTKFNLVVKGDKGIVTGMRNFTKREVQNMANNQGWESLPFKK